MLEVAKKTNALVLYFEHRFFGSSLPLGSTESFQKGPQRIGLLSVEQSLADYAAILREHKRRGPAITFGGSLSGTLAALMRIQYPALVQAAYASSAPVLGYPGVVDQFAWRRRITQNF